MDLTTLCTTLASTARAAATELATVRTVQKNDWLMASAQAVLARQDELLAANVQDIASAPDYGLNAAAIDRLTLTPKRIQAIAEGLRQVAALPDPVGEVREGGMRPNGLQVLKVGVPLGVLFFLYESRPNVTADAAALAVKSGNAVILRGGKEATYSNTALHTILTELLPRFDLPLGAVQRVPTADREAVGILLQMKDQIDLVIPRGGESLIRRVASEAAMPVLKHYLGVCHIYIDRSADPVMAERIVVNAKCQRPAVCNALETLLVHREAAAAQLPQLGAKLREQGVEIRGCERTQDILSWCTPAQHDDWGKEYADLILAVKIVDSQQEAMQHIRRYGSGHTDAIIATDWNATQEFIRHVDSSAVVVNASTRFNDGFELGLGAEIGISTDRMHARGPCGLRELCTTKYIVTGNGQIRE